MFSIFDSKAEVYGNPFFVQSTGSAIRSFSDEVNSTNRESMIAAHPDDFTLFELGSFNVHEGTFEIYAAKKSLGVGLNFKRNDK